MMDEQLPQAPLAHLKNRDSWLWLNPRQADTPVNDAKVSQEIEKTRHRMARSQRLLRALFDLPDTGRSALYSPLLSLADIWPKPAGQWFAKADHELPIAGSIKARGGFHEVIAHAEQLALEHGLIQEGEDLLALASEDARTLFAKHSIVVGSTGNLGMSIGLCGAALGFKAVVHMSTDAKEWKKQRLREHGAVVVEHAGDYGEAVAQGRALAAADPFAYFVDDESSIALFTGYAIAAFELQAQLANSGIEVNADHPLCVYIPCGVGGAPGGITYGLKLIFGAHVHCFFAEPVESPCMLLQLSGNSSSSISVYDIGLANRTDLDGLAVGAASMFVAPLMQERLAGIYTVTDQQAYALLRSAHAIGIDVEPSAATAFGGPEQVIKMLPELTHATHVSWTTGGSLVPIQEFQRFLKTPIAEP